MADARRGVSLYRRLTIDETVNADFLREARAAAGAGVAQRPWFPGWGDISVYDDLKLSLPQERPHKVLLGEFASTSICGNDITSSCFYVTGAMAAAAGIWAPFGAIFAVVTLWLFRWVYTEAVTALPFNGGIYNILLNTLQSKHIAALVATLTMLSYIATAVVSALSAGSYLQSVIDDSKMDPMQEGNHSITVAVALIVAFCLLKCLGISESAAVASVMFAGHLLTMSLLILVTTFAIALPREGLLPFGLVLGNLRANFQFTGGATGLPQRIVIGFSNAMLGVSGFESSANFVEEQQPGVFPKTLRNMWLAVSVLNLTFILQCLFATKLDELMLHKDMSLSYLALQVSGPRLQLLVSADAVVVLAASVLTSYVGFGGLMHRMSGDRCLPSIFRHNDKVAPVVFMCICISLVLILKGDSTDLDACYSFAFLTVMGFFAISLFILQMQRPKLPRDIKNNSLIPAAAFILVVIALSSALISNQSAVPVFLLYLAVLNAFMLVFLFRIRLLRALNKILSANSCMPKGWLASLSSWTESIHAQQCVVYFTKTSNICRLNKAIHYVRKNEDATRCRIVHVYKTEDEIPRKLVQYCQILDAIYPTIRIDVVFIRGVFGAQIIEHLCSKWELPPNLMFMTCPTSDSSGKRIQDLCGVRVIMSHEEEESCEEFSPFAVPDVTPLEYRGNSGSLEQAVQSAQPFLQQRSWA